MDGFVECWEGLEDPRTGKAGRHAFYELLMIEVVPENWTGGYARVPSLERPAGQRWRRLHSGAINSSPGK